MHLPLFLLLLSWSVQVVASDESFDCHVKVGGLNYDLTYLPEEQTVTRLRQTPPTSEVDSVRLSLCSDLKPQEGVPETDQCPSGTRVCFTKINRKDDLDRIVSVIPIAQALALNPSLSALSSTKGLAILLHGGSYPHPINVTDTQQSVNITLLCDPDSDKESAPVFTSYDGARLELQWSHPAGCPSQGDNGNDENEDERPGNTKSGSGLSSVGWFLLLLLLAFATYMGLGAYYNYSTYGSSGLDLIPHRDFWMEVPYMLKDVLSHLCSTVRPRRPSNRGYIAV
ncbi:autophagy-related protein 27 [Mycena maculata]|uniref:Autophagy-related protein 27 n=1 Tax=Mycena maculata TaxID=230809 RepID=A0AAD7JRW1_9AGAR|nr:autophagy-related protein 27 [Mycena maculata]